MKTRSAIAAFALLFVFAASCYAADEVKFDLLENAQKAAATSGKGIFLICFAVVPGDKTNAQIQFTAAIKADKDIAAAAANFEMAMVNCFSLAHAKSNQCVNPELARRYGWPCTASVYGPGAVKHLWRKEMSHDDTNSRHEHSKEDIAECLKEAVEAWKGVRTAIDDIEAKIKADKSLKSDPDAQSQLAEAWAKAGSAVNARVAFNEAIKAAKKADKTDPRIESLSLRAAEVEFECEAWVAAAKGFADFYRTFKDSENVPLARVKEAAAIGKNGEVDKARQMLQAIMKDKKAASALDDAKEALREIENPAK